MPEDTTGPVAYVALQPLQFGDRLLQPGEPVPHEAGRSYHQMLSFGQIAPAPAVTPAHGGLVTDEAVVFVDQSGQWTAVVYLGLQLPDEVARVTLDLEPGELAALVQFEEDPEPSLVPLPSLLPGEAAGRLIAALEVRIQTAADEPAASQLRVIAGHEERVAFLELLVRAIRQPGAPLPADFPGAREAEANGLSTLDGLALLAAGERGRAHLILLDGIGAKTADKMLLALQPTGAASTSPDAPATPASAIPDPAVPDPTAADPAAPPPGA
jgi:hypothetical protein